MGIQEISEKIVYYLLKYSSGKLNPKVSFSKNKEFAEILVDQVNSKILVKKGEIIVEIYISEIHNTSEEYEFIARINNSASDMLGTITISDDDKYMIFKRTVLKEISKDIIYDTVTPFVTMVQLSGLISSAFDNVVKHIETPKEAVANLGKVKK